MFEISENQKQLEEQLKTGQIRGFQDEPADRKKTDEDALDRDDVIHYIQRDSLGSFSNAGGASQMRNSRMLSGDVSQNRSTLQVDGQQNLSASERNNEPSLQVPDEDVFNLSAFDFVKEVQVKRQIERMGRFDVHGKTVFYSKTSLYIMHQTSEFRKVLVWIIEWKWFERFIIFSIILQAISLTLFDYADRDSLTKRNQILNTVGDVFSVLFFVEAGLKIGAQGFVFHKYAYLRDTWNIADFIIVVTGMVDLMRFRLNLKALRILRVIRPLRSIKAIPSMRRLVSTLLRALPELGNSTIFITFMILLFSILGVQQFGGISYFKCRLTKTPDENNFWPKSPHYTRVCSPPEASGLYSCPADLYCGSPVQYGISLEDDGVHSDAEIQFGINSFDHFGVAILSVIQIITAENWSKIMYTQQDGYSPFFTQLYFCVLVVVGHYYILQLLLAVIMSNLSQIMAREMHDDIQKKEQEVKDDKERIRQIKKQQREEMYALQMQSNQNSAPVSEMFNLDEEEEKEDGEKSGKPRLRQRAKMNRQASGVNRASLESNNKTQLPMGQLVTDSLGTQSNQLLPIKQQKNKLKSSNRQINKSGRHSSTTLNKENSEQAVQRINSDKSAHDLKQKFSKINPTVAKWLNVDFKKKKNWTQQQKFDEIIKGMFMWNMGNGQGSHLDLTKGLGLAIFSHVIDVKQIEAGVKVYKDKIKYAKNLDDLQERHYQQQEIYDKVSMLVRQLELMTSKQYQKSRRVIYGIDNEIHLVELIQKTLSVMLKHSPEKMAKSKLLPIIFKMMNENRNRDLRGSFDSTKEIQQQYADLSISEQMELSLKISHYLKELSISQTSKEFFFVRFKRLLYRKNLIDKIHKKISNDIFETQLRVRAKKNSIYQWCYNLQNSRWFQIFTVFVIMGNSIVLALSKYPVDPSYEKRLDYFNLAFFGFFLLELSIKLAGQGYKNFYSDQINLFDSGVIFISAVDIVIQYLTTNSSESGSGAITALRVLRLVRVFRVFRLAKVWKDFQDLLKAISKTFKEISNVSILLGILTFTYTLIGMELYANKVKFDSENKLDLSENGVSPRFNFNNPYQAFLSVFIVLANDGWTRIYYDHYRATDPITSTLFFLTLLIIGQYIILNLFIAVLIENFDQLSIRNDLINKLNTIREKTLFRKMLDCFQLRKQGGRVQPTSDAIDDLINHDVVEKKRLIDEDMQRRPSVQFIHYNNKVRQMCKKLIQHKYFEWVMLVIIVQSTLQLAMDNPLNDPESVMSKLLVNLDYFLTAIFTIESVIKIIAFGFMFCGSTSYMRNGWNVLDITIVIISLASMGLPTNNLSVVKVVRLLKVLRPLRVISRNQGLKISIRTLGVALPGIINVLVVNTLFNFICGIIGVNYFKGRLFDCSFVEEVNDNVQRDLKPIIDTKWDCINSGGEWKQSFLNFDNIYNAMQSFFIVSTGVSWSDLMYQTATIRGYDMVLATEIQSYLTPLFFVFVVIIGNFFLMNQFVGVIISTYNREKELLGKDYMLSESQKKQAENRLMYFNIQPKFRMKMPPEDWRQPFFFIASNSYVQSLIQLCIIGNTIVLTLEWTGQKSDFSGSLETANFIFAGIFTGECVIKLIGYGKRYFLDSWNIFDLIIVLLTVIGIVYGMINTSNSIGAQTTVIRSFRIARIFFFFKRNKALKGTFQTFIGCIPAIANITMLLGLIVLIYSILGMYIFADIKFNGNLTDYANFTSVTNALVTLIRITTGEEWPKLMESLSRSKAIDFHCLEQPTYADYVNNGFKPLGCGSTLPAVAYFFSYTLIIGMVFLRLFIAIILQTFQDITERDQKFINSDLTDHFREIWMQYDPDATGYIKKIFYPKFLISLGNPLGWDVSYEHNYNKQQEYFSEVTLPMYNRKKEYEFMDVFEKLVAIMIIRREIIHFGIKNNLPHLLTVEKAKDIIDELQKKVLDQAKQTVFSEEAQKRLNMDDQNQEDEEHIKRNQVLHDQEAVGSGEYESVAERTDTNPFDTLNSSLDGLKNRSLESMDGDKKAISIIINQSQKHHLRGNRGPKMSTDSLLQLPQGFNQMQPIYDSKLNRREVSTNNERMKSRSVRYDDKSLFYNNLRGLNAPGAKQRKTGGLRDIEEQNSAVWKDFSSSDGTNPGKVSEESSEESLNYNHRFGGGGGPPDNDGAGGGIVEPNIQITSPNMGTFSYHIPTTQPRRESMEVQNNQRQQSSTSYSPIQLGLQQQSTSSPFNMERNFTPIPMKSGFASGQRLVNQQPTVEEDIIDDGNASQRTLKNLKKSLVSPKNASQYQELLLSEEGTKKYNSTLQKQSPEVNSLQSTPLKKEFIEEEPRASLQLRQEQSTIVQQIASETPEINNQQPFKVQSNQNAIGSLGQQQIQNPSQKLQQPHQIINDDQQLQHQSISDLEKLVNGEVGHYLITDPDQEEEDQLVDDEYMIQEMIHQTNNSIYYDQNNQNNHRLSGKSSIQYYDDDLEAGGGYISSHRQFLTQQQQQPASQSEKGDFKPVDDDSFKNHTTTQPQKIVPTTTKFGPKNSNPAATTYVVPKKTTPTVYKRQNTPGGSHHNHQLIGSSAGLSLNNSRRQAQQQQTQQVQSQQASTAPGSAGAPQQQQQQQMMNKKISTPIDTLINDDNEYDEEDEEEASYYIDDDDDQEEADYVEDEVALAIAIADQQQKEEHKNHHHHSGSNNNEDSRTEEYQDDDDINTMVDEELSRMRAGDGATTTHSHGSSLQARSFGQKSTDFESKKNR